MKTEGVAATPHASRYLQQVCKHWGHRFVVEFDDARGHVDFGDGSSVDFRAGDDSLQVLIDCPAESVEIAKGIVVAHIDRFAHKEGALAYTWRPSSS